MAELLELMERVNDTVVQTRCDRRSLATILVAFREKGAHVTSLSSLLRMIIEQMRYVVLNSGTEEVLSTEDATTLIKGLGRAGLNPGHRAMFTHKQQRERESSFLEYGSFDHNTNTRTRRTKELLNKSPQIDLSDSVQEEATANFLQQRRDQELKTMKSELRLPPNMVRDKNE